MTARSEARSRDDANDNWERPARPAEARSAIPRIGALSYRVDSVDDDDYDVPDIYTASGNADVPGNLNAVIGLHLVAEPPVVGAVDPVVAPNVAIGELVLVDPRIIARAPVVDSAEPADAAEADMSVSADTLVEPTELPGDPVIDRANWAAAADPALGEGTLVDPEILAKAPTVGAADPAFRNDVLAGLAASPRAIPARWFYDRRGSELFEAITRLPEYYLTRIERGILTAHCADVAALTGPGYAIVEFGSGSSAKTPLLLSALEPSAYVPIDISGDFLRESVAALADEFPDLPIHPVEGDFMHPLVLPPSIGDAPRLGFFPGSTIGNLTAPASIDLLRAMAKTLGEGSMLVIGIDRIKPADVLIPAYDDARGVTAEFNLNLLHRINRELEANVPVSDFKHVARWNDTEARIEMHLKTTRDVSFKVDGHAFAMAQGETIHTENSYKYGPRDARLLLRAGGWTPIAEWTDRDGLFALILAEARPIPAAP
jgi:L-histidine N-alpha-methyltransferase